MKWKVALLELPIASFVVDREAATFPAAVAVTAECAFPLWA